MDSSDEISEKPVTNTINWEKISTLQWFIKMQEAGGKAWKAHVDIKAM